MTNHDFIPDPYAADLQRRRTPQEHAFIERRAIEHRSIEARAAAVSAEVASTLRTLQADDDLAQYAPPCPYCTALRGV